MKPLTCLGFAASLTALTFSVGLALTGLTVVALIDLACDRATQSKSSLTPGSINPNTNTNNSKENDR